jgi:RNase P subunit RPR2
MQFPVRDTRCPRCHKAIAATTIERYRTREEQVHYNYQCPDCGPVLTKIISLRADTPTQAKAPKTDLPLGGP